MTRTGTTNRQGRSYSYYSCAGAHQKGEIVCKGRHIPAGTLDEIVLTNLKQCVLAPDRIADLLRSLMERQAAKSECADRRVLDLQRELSDAADRLKRLYRSIEDGIVELDDILRERTATLKSQRERAKAALDHARAQCGTAATIDAEKIDAFSRLMNKKPDTADTNTGKVRSIRSWTPSKSMTKPSGLSAARTSSRPPLPANRQRTEMFVNKTTNSSVIEITT
jgi:site-specific DNA recombinase